MIPDLILDVILDLILHGFGAFGRASIRPCEQVLETEPIMSKQAACGIPRQAPGESRMTRYIV
jgi:hypothetical protein